MGFKVTSPTQIRTSNRRALDKKMWLILNHSNFLQNSVCHIFQNFLAFYLSFQLCSKITKGSAKKSSISKMMIEEWNALDAQSKWINDKDPKWWSRYVGKVENKKERERNRKSINCALIKIFRFVSSNFMLISTKRIQEQKKSNKHKFSASMIRFRFPVIYIFNICWALMDLNGKILQKFTFHKNYRHQHSILCLTRTNYKISIYWALNGVWVGFTDFSTFFKNSENRKYSFNYRNKSTISLTQ